jgi:Solitary outer membrane autotransporter beta-barrel domain
MRGKAILAAIAICFASVTAHAQSGPQLPPELGSQVNRIIDQVVNSVLIFTSQASASSGNLTFDGNGEPDIDVEILRFPVEYDFAAGEAINPFLEGGLGFLHLVERIPPIEGPGQNDFSTVRTWTAGLGGGVKFSPADKFEITPSFSATYANIRNRYDYNNEISQVLLEPFGKQLFNWRVETITYTPTLKIGYEIPLGRQALLLRSRYSHLFNDTISTDSPTIDVSSDTGLWQNVIGLEIPLGLCADGETSEFAIRGLFTRNEIYGSARQGLGLNHFYEATVDLLADVKESLGVVSEVRFGGSYIWGDDLTGWRLSFGWGF